MGFDKTAAKPKSKPTAIAPSITEEEVDDLTDEIFTQPLNLKTSKLPSLAYINTRFNTHTLFSYNHSATLHTASKSARERETPLSTAQESLHQAIHSLSSLRAQCN
jgi:hypothetical protein